MKNLIAILLAVVLCGCDSNTASPTLGYQVDAARERSWWLSREGVLMHSASEAKKVVPLPGWLWAGSPHCPPDIALGPNGEAVITSNVVSTVWRVDPQTFAVSVHELKLASDDDKDVGFAAIVYSPAQSAFLGYSEIQRSAWKIDSSLWAAAKLTQTDFARVRAQRSRAVRTPCADLRQRLSSLAGIND